MGSSLTAVRFYLESVHIGGSFRADLGNRFRQRNQSRQWVSSAGFVIRSCATPHEPGGGTITSSPGCQSAGVATLCSICRLHGH